MYCSGCGTEAPASAKFCVNCGLALAQAAPEPAVSVETKSLPEPSRFYAGFWRRTAAALIDGVILLLLGSWLEPVFPEMLGANAALIVWPCVAFYFIVFEASPLQGTPGKRLMGIKVTNLLGEPPSVIRVFARTVAKILSIVTLGFGFVLVAFSARRQSLHDLVTRGLVVSAKQQPVANALPYGKSMPFSAALGWFVIVIVVFVLFTVGSVWHEEPKSFEELMIEIRADGKDDPKATGKRFKLPKRIVRVTQ